MRLMSFIMTEKQLLSGEKDVTRRLGWGYLKVGALVCAVQKVQGLKKGEKVKRLAILRILTIRREKLNEITQDDCRREGFPNLTPTEFVLMFSRAMNCREWDYVNRIEFKIVTTRVNILNGQLDLFKGESLAMARDLEHHAQVAVINWANCNRYKHPELELIFAIPNGGHRHGLVARKLRDEGVKAGVPDLFLPVPRGRWHGLFIEIKEGKNKTTPLQREWISNLCQQGYKVDVCYGSEQAIESLEWYLS